MHFKAHWRLRALLPPGFLETCCCPWAPSWGGSFGLRMWRLPSFKVFHKNVNFGLNFLQNVWSYLELLKTQGCFWWSLSTDSWMLLVDGTWKLSEGFVDLAYVSTFWTLALSWSMKLIMVAPLAIPPNLMWPSLGQSVFVEWYVCTSMTCLVPVIPRLTPTISCWLSFGKHSPSRWFSTWVLWCSDWQVWRWHPQTTPRGVFEEGQTLDDFQAPWSWSRTWSKGSYLFERSFGRYTVALGAILSSPTGEHLDPFRVDLPWFGENCLGSKQALEVCEREQWRWTQLLHSTSTFGALHRHCLWCLLWMPPWWYFARWLFGDVGS